MATDLEVTCKQSKTRGADSYGESTSVGSSTSSLVQKVQDVPSSSTKDKGKRFVAPTRLTLAVPIWTSNRDPNVRSLTIEPHFLSFVFILADIILKDHLKDISLLEGEDNLFLHSLSCTLSRVCYSLFYDSPLNY